MDETNAVYFQALGRAADPLGLSLFPPFLEAGISPELVAVDLFASTEYYNTPH
jgi:hypothetical protein